MLLFCSNVFSQQSLKNIRKASWQSFIYRVPADTAEKYIHKTIYSPTQYLRQQPVMVKNADSVNIEEFPNGNYLILTVDNNNLVAHAFSRSSLQVKAVNNQHHVQLEIRNSAGSYVNSALVWINKIPARYDPATRGYRVSQKNPEDDVVKIVVDGDTSFYLLSRTYEIEKGSWSQWWTNFSYSRAGKILAWPVRTVKRMITTPPRQWIAKKYRRGYTGAGYMVFNKPRYKPLDTLKFKAYILTKKGKQYKDPLNISLQYYENGYVKIPLTTLKPSTPGAFIYEFILGDTLQSDRQYDIVFTNKEKHAIYKRSFRIEDYVLDEMAEHSIRSQKDSYFRNDTMVFSANAKDANGLAVMDGTVTLYVLTQNIRKFYKDDEFIPDTLWKQEKVLAVNGDTKFGVPLTNFPAADMGLDVQAEFRNSNNELAIEKTGVDFFHQAFLIQAKQEDNEVRAELILNGRPVAAKGWLKKTYSGKPVEISFPFSEKTDTYTGEYFFFVLDEKQKIIASHNFIPESYRVTFRRIQSGDTTGFMLYNPLKIPVYYTIFFGNRIIASGGDSTEWVSWKSKLTPSRAYQVNWQYYWAGQEEKKGETLAVLDKLLQSDISEASTIYPGQTDTITVSVKDYKGRPAPDVNLTAVSYNNQFGNSIQVPEPSYIKRYRNKRRIVHDTYQIDSASVTRNFALGQHQTWITRFGLDSMVYYKLLFPTDKFYTASTVIENFTPELAVHIVRQGKPQEIYMLYINRQLVYYNGATDKSNYAFSVVPGYAKIGIRLREQYIEIDSIYLQPYYKKDISFDIDHLPAGSRVEKRPAYYTYEERWLLQNSMWQIADDPRTNYGYVWQNDRLVFLKPRNYSYSWNYPVSHQWPYISSHIVGPFVERDSLQFFKPGDFDLKFAFESNYEYRLSPKMARLQRNTLFKQDKKVYLPIINRTEWILGDTVDAPPLIQYNKRPVPVRLEVNDFKFTLAYGKGALQIELPADTAFIYAVLFKQADTLEPRVKNFDFTQFKNLDPGIYDLVLVTAHFQFVEVNGIGISANGTRCIQIRSSLYNSANNHIADLLRTYEKENFTDNNKIPARQNDNESAVSIPQGNASISGRVTDKKGNAGIPFATVYLKGYNNATATGRDGSFTIRNIKPGSYTLVVTSVGYQFQEINAIASEGFSIPLNIGLAVAENNLEEVIVVGYGTVKRKNLSASVSSITSDELSFAFSGRVPGINVQYNDSMSVRIRGTGSIGDAKPIYVVDGIVMDKLPEGFNLGKARIDVLKGASAVALYGSKAANGVIIVTTSDLLPKELRDQFRDYAFWHPNLFTDEDGNVKFTVTYPDNITGWQTFVVGMDKRNRITKATRLVKSFKPLVAQLSAPQFLVEGDSISFIGKTTNYTDKDYAATTRFTVNDKKQAPVNKQLVRNAAEIEELAVVAGNADTLSAQYTVTTDAGYTDGELRKIPVVGNGIQEAAGSFWILDKDTVISFMPDKRSAVIKLHAENNTLAVMLDELENLRKYPYFCMEQVASKLTGLVMERKIKDALKLDFRDEKEIQKLLSRLQKSQLYEGAWSWWEGGTPNLTITNYITRALLMLRDQPLVQTNIRNALLYLQNQLANLDRDQLIATLFTLSEAGHVIYYKNYIDRLNFDSLTVHQQWEFVRIKQLQKLPYEYELNQLIRKKKETMLGGIYWGEDSYHWDRNRMATTVLAFKTLQDETKNRVQLKQIIQFFMEQRNKGKWMNTVESASIVSAILPYILNENEHFNTPAVLQIDEGIAAPVMHFPFTVTLTSGTKPITITKSGGGLVYLTAYQEMFNRDPLPVMGKFNIRTWFERWGNNIASLQAGEKTIMNIELEVTKDADYVQVEIPIPAGCTYGDKKQVWNMHREFLKDKSVFFIEKLAKGVYNYEIELEPRYSGVFTINPAKAELMYFPVFFGRNATKRVTIKNKK